MQEFVVTDTAGKDVAGRKNPGSGSTIFLTEAQAAHALRLGYLRRAGTATAENDGAEVAPALVKKAHRRRRRK